MPHHICYRVIEQQICRIRAVMKKAIRAWMSGKDFYDPSDPICSSHNGVLNLRGLPVGICYYSHATGRRHQIIAEDCDERVRRYLKDRRFVEHPRLYSIVEPMMTKPSPADIAWNNAAIHHINSINALLSVIGSPPAYRSGRDFIPDDNAAADDLSIILLQMAYKKSPPIPYLVQGQCNTDILTIAVSPSWIPLGKAWYGTRDLMEFTLFKIGRIKSRPIELV